MPPITKRTMGRVQLVQRWIQQTIADVKQSLTGVRSPEYIKGWRAACDACRLAFNDPLAVEDAVTAKATTTTTKI